MPACEDIAVGGAQVSEKHCGFIVNADHATAADVDELIRHIQATVKDQFNVDLEPEVHRVGEFLKEGPERGLHFL